MTETQSDCIFCKIIQKETETKIEFEDDAVIAFRSKYPAAEVHLLIVPKIHAETFLDLNDETISNLKNAAQKIIEQLGIKGGYKLAINGGKYQAIRHFHWHLLAGKLEDQDDVLNRT